MILLEDVCKVAQHLLIHFPIQLIMSVLNNVHLDGILQYKPKLVCKFVLMEHLPTAHRLVFKCVQTDSMVIKIAILVKLIVLPLVNIKITLLICVYQNAQAIRACLLKIQLCNVFSLVPLILMLILSIELVWLLVLHLISLTKQLLLVF